MNPYLSVQELLFDWEARLAQHLNAFQHVITLAAQRDTQINTQMERITALASTLKQAELAQRHIDTAIVRIEQDKKNIQDLIVHIERELNLFADLNEDRMTQDQRSRKKLFDDAIHTDAKLTQFEKQTSEVGTKLNEINLQHLNSAPADLAGVLQSLSEQDKALQALSDIAIENRKQIAVIEDLMGSLQ